MQSAAHLPRGYDQLPSIDLKWDADAIRWLQNNVSGSPVILEAHNLEYGWNGRISVYTGLPTVLGWPWHQMQQRWDYLEVVVRRAEDVRLMYDTAELDLALALLLTYGVEYVVVGELERRHYSEAGLQRFDELTAQGLMRLAYRKPGSIHIPGRRTPLSLLLLLPSSGPAVINIKVVTILTTTR